MTEASEPLLAVAVGNTRTRVGLFDGRSLRASEVVASADPQAILQAIRKLAEGEREQATIVSSVNAPASRRLIELLEPEMAGPVLRIGKDVPIRMPLALDDASTLGEDRLVCALAAYARTEQAVVVIDAGTAITVDFVDGEGTFQGGIILPGLRMMLRALHEHTAALPNLEYRHPDPARGPFGKDTAHAMMLGATSAAVGAVRYALEQFAERYGAYPQVVATGGDAATLFASDEIVEHIVPELQLMGLAEAFVRMSEPERAPGGVGEAEDDADDES